MSTISITSDLQEIRDWVEKRNGFPVEIRGAKPEDSLSLIFDKNDRNKESYKKISWNGFSEKLDSLLLAFQYEDTETEEGLPNYKFVSRSNN